MVDKLKTRLAREESGFTLIELLVVLIILAILLAIAIPSYLSFRGRANSVAAKADIRSLVPSIEAFNGDNIGTATDADAVATTTGYQGLTLALLKSGVAGSTNNSAGYDQSLTVGTGQFEWVHPTDATAPAALSGDANWIAPSTTDYCAVAQVSDWVAWKRGPAGAIKVVQLTSAGALPAASGFCT
jgi:prepilin-type N-terminal cleavage/methylation domain-containing protein